MKDTVVFPLRYTDKVLLLLFFPCITERAQKLGRPALTLLLFRFLFILLGPKGKAKSYHEIGRAIATLMSDEVWAFPHPELGEEAGFDGMFLVLEAWRLAGQFRLLLLLLHPLCSHSKAQTVSAQGLGLDPRVMAIPHTCREHAEVMGEQK